MNLVMKNKEIGMWGRGTYKRRSLLTFFPLKRGRGVLLEKEGLFERGGLIEDLQWYGAWSMKCCFFTT